VRGAPALQRALESAADRLVRALVVWEPVLSSDLGPPLANVRAHVRDRRATQVWDPDLSLSKAMIAAWRRDRSREPVPGWTEDERVVWDCVQVHAAGARWADGAPPQPAWSGGPVVRVEAELTRRLR
jgi:hypothetical protein